jgi:E3 ubiquitin-protein ligase RAD18
MLNDRALRKKLQELGIPTWGTKPQLIKRHQEWLNIYNSNCDASDAARKSKRELLRELDEWERTQGGHAQAKESHIMRKDFDGQNYATAHKDQFADLIANARKRAKDAQKASEQKAETVPTGNSGVGPQPPQPENPEPTPDPPHPYENNEAALSSIRQKVEEANRTDSAFPILSHNTKNANMKGAQNAGHHQKDIPFGFGHENPLGSPTRKVPMFKMPEEPVVDVESSAAMQ